MSANREDARTLVRARHTNASLAQLVRDAAARAPDAIALRAPDATLTYGELDLAAARAARALVEMGVRRGDRVGIWIEKGCGAVVAMQAALRIGAAYVPIDPASPTIRARTILEDAGVRAIATDARRMSDVVEGRLADLGVLLLSGDAPSRARCVRFDELATLPSHPIGESSRGEDLAYVLYTSGSTGRPKGVCLSHGNALAFVTWAAHATELHARDRVSSHAPFHFDLSVFDLYASFSVGAAISIVPEGASYAPARLLDFIESERISVWYSVPSALILMMERGGLLDRRRPDDLRVVVFAGEVFPIRHLRALFRHWRGARFLNWYGPTETNVCTAHEVAGADVADDRSEPVPIGHASCGNRVWARTDDGGVARASEEGELVVDGPTVMLGYFGAAPLGGRPYETGDIVRARDDGSFVFVGRRDHMVKVRGHRVELGEVEAALLAHPSVRAAAVVVRGSGADARLVAFVVSDVRIPILALKRHCAERLPRSMIVDEAHALGELPRTPNGKIDRRELARRADEIERSREPALAVERTDGES